MDLVTLRNEGLYCAAGDFYVDPWCPVDRAVITHAHADHARAGHRKYLAATDGARVLRQRLGDISVDFIAYGESIDINGVKVSMHPAGHVLGSAQVRIEYGGEIWVISGDYKLDADPTCRPFEPQRCDTFITEATFALPLYRWETPQRIFAAVNAWWRANCEAGRASVLFAYALGKAQRVLAGIDSGIGPLVCHGAVEAMNEAYRASGLALPKTWKSDDVAAQDVGRALVIAPPSAQATPWLRRFGEYSDAYASGWMQVRGARRRRGVDRGFVLSDHADWPGLLHAITATGAQRVIATHGYSAVLARWLQQRGLAASTFETEYGAEEGEVPVAEPDAPRPEGTSIGPSSHP